MHSYTWFQIFVCLNAGLVTLLALNVSRLRVREKVANGDGDKLVMKKAIRAHGNGVEHVVIFGLCLLALTGDATPLIPMGVLVMAFTLSRVAHAVSMLGASFQLRRFAAGGTYLCELAALASLAAAIPS